MELGLRLALGPGLWLLLRLNVGLWRESGMGLGL